MKFILTLFTFIFFLLHISVFSQKSDTLNIEVKNAGSQINSAYSDYGPVITSDGSLMIYTSRRPIEAKDIKKLKESNEQVYSAKYDSKTKAWIDAEILKTPINIENRNSSVITISNDGQRMLLYRDDNQGNGDIYESDLEGTEWSEPTKIPEPINSVYHESSASISPDGRTIYFVSKRPTKTANKEDRNIWYCTQDESGKWGEAKEIGDVINTKEDEEMPFMHPNGKTLFFSSKGHNSMGGFDVFMTTFDEETKTWSTPESLEQPINSLGDDVGFVMKANGKTGYYSSPREDGLGDKDIYKIIFHKDIMKKHLTLYKGRILNEKGKPVSSKISVKDKSNGELVGTFASNSTSGEYLISLPEGKTYEIEFSSEDHFANTETLDVPRSKGFNEINKDITLKPKFAYITGRVLDESGNPMRVQVEIELIDSVTHQSIGKYKTDADGRYNIKVPPGKNYNVVFNKTGYFFHSMKVQAPDKAGEIINLSNIVMQKVDIGKKVVLENIFFDVGKATLRSESISELERAFKMMNDMKTLEIEISGHTDNTGSNASNKALSESRAKTVVDYLISKGIDASRLQSAGYASQFPVATNETEEGRQLNRRTEFKVTKIDMDAEQMAELQKLKTAFVEGAKKETTNKAKKKSTNKKLPKDFQRFDDDTDNTISAAEVFLVIDSYFEGGENIKFQDITDLIDFYLDE